VPKPIAIAYSPFDKGADITSPLMVAPPPPIATDPLALAIGFQLSGGVLPHFKHFISGPDAPLAQQIRLVFTWDIMDPLLIGIIHLMKKKGENVLFFWIALPRVSPRRYSP
jgi:hypothetical protein